MIDYAPDRAWAAYRETKSRALRHKTLTCGCPNDGRDTYLWSCCRAIVCREHARGEHCRKWVAA
jgi:hypothetical protein